MTADPALLTREARRPADPYTSGAQACRAGGNGAAHLMPSRYMFPVQ
jgi:hypothetical protein